MNRDALRDALAAIAAAATDGLAALGDADTEPAPAVDVPDYHAQDLERIEANAAATVAVIEAEAAADVARIEAAAANAVEPDADDAPGALDLGEPVEQLDQLADDASAENPIDPPAAPPIETPADAIDADANLDAAGAVLDALPAVDLSDAAEDIAPRNTHWWVRPLWGSR